MWFDNLSVNYENKAQDYEKLEQNVFEKVIINLQKWDAEYKIWNKEDIKIKYVSDWVFAFMNKQTGNVNYYVDSNWNIIFWLISTRERRYVEGWEVFNHLWIMEKSENNIYNMYRIVGSWENGNILNWPIKPESEEYYKIWLDVIFCADIYDKLYMLKFHKKEDKEWLELLIKHWSYKFEDLELFKKEGLIRDDLFQFWILELRKIIISQCSDKRLIHYGIWIKESDIKTYLEKWYIDRELAKKCYQVLSKEMKDLTFPKN